MVAGHSWHTRKEGEELGDNVDKFESQVTIDDYRKYDRGISRSIQPFVTGTAKSTGRVMR